MTPTVYFATPIRGRNVVEQYNRAQCETIMWASREGIKCEWMVLPDQPDPSVGRNVLTADFLASDKTHLFFVDADVGWQIADVKAVLKASQSHYGIVGGVYAKKTYPYQPAVGKVLQIESGMAEVAYLAGGFTLIPRGVIEAMDAHYSYPKLLLPHDQPAHEYFHHRWRFSVSDGLVSGEDVTFCKDWRAIGGKCWAVPGLSLTHTGEHTFTKRWELA